MIYNSWSNRETVLITRNRTAQRPAQFPFSETTEQVDPAVMLYTCIREVLGSNLGPDIGYPDWRFSWVLQSFQANPGSVTLLGHYRFLPNPFPYIIHEPSSRSTLQSLDSDRAVNEPRGKVGI
jgi:hypothetical protein